MRKPHIIALACADLHLHDWPLEGYPDHYRLSQAQNALRKVVHEATKHEVDVWIAGDLVHNPKLIDNFLFTEIITGFKYIKDVYEDTSLLMISGNHDHSEKNTLDYVSPSYTSGICCLSPNFIDLNYKTCLSGNCQVHGIPYLDGNVGLRKAIRRAIKKFGKFKRNVLLLHTDRPGAKEADGREVGTVENWEGIPKLLKKFDLVIYGHIHRPQRFNRREYMLGAMNHQKTSDEGCEMGYWEVYSDFTMKFKPLGLPEFKTVKEIPKDDFSNYWILEGKEVVESSEESIPVVDFSTTNKKISLAKKYLTKKGIKSKSKKNTLIKVIKASTK